MSRFADARATRTVDLGPCECPGAPHENDWAKVRADLAATDIALLSATNSYTIAGVAAEFVVEWNLLGPNGEPWDPNGEALTALKTPTLTLIVSALTDAIKAATPLPNTSGVPSAKSSLGNASRTPATSH